MNSGVSALSAEEFFDPTLIFSVCVSLCLSLTDQHRLDFSYVSDGDDPGVLRQAHAQARRLHGPSALGVRSAWTGKPREEERGVYCDVYPVI